MDRSDSLVHVDKVLAHLSKLSMKPWSNVTEADYSLEQWHGACLIHQHVGPPTDKGQCKLPVRNPDGAVNQNGVYAAVAALAGARGGVDATATEKTKAAKILIQLYHDMNKPPPPSLLSHSGEEFLAHHGILGQRWGHRKPEGNSVPNESGDATSVTLYSKPGKGIVKTSGGEGRLPSSDAKSAAAYKQIANKSSTNALSNKELQHLVSRINLEQQYSKLANAPKRQSAGRKFVSNLLKSEGKQFMVGKKGPIVTVIGNTLGGSGGSHRSNAYPVGVFKKSYATSKHRP